MFKMRVRKLEEKIKSCPRGDFPFRGHELFLVLDGIFLKSPDVCLCASGHQSEQGLLFS